MELLNVLRLREELFFPSGIELLLYKSAFLVFTFIIFANDTLVFCESNKNVLLNLRFLLLCFQTGSNFEINLVKSNNKGDEKLQIGLKLLSQHNEIAIFQCKIGRESIW